MHKDQDEHLIHDIDLIEVKDFILNQSPETKVYIGADSKREKGRSGRWYAVYTCAVVVHIDGKHGCKTFNKTIKLPDYDARKDAPKMRMMQETYMVADMFLALADVLQDRYYELHLDINPDEKYGSSCAIKEAIGYIRGVCNVTPMVKPVAYAASFTADRGTSLLKSKSAG